VICHHSYILIKRIIIMRFIQRTAGYTKWDLQQNEDVMKELHIEPALDYLTHQKQ
jgi:hypothetical protein